jgi:hypothetical protein
MDTTAGARQGENSQRLKRMGLFSIYPFAIWVGIMFQNQIARIP